MTPQIACAGFLLLLSRMGQAEADARHYALAGEQRQPPGAGHDRAQMGGRDPRQHQRRRKSGRIDRRRADGRRLCRFPGRTSTSPAATAIRHSTKFQRYDAAGNKLGGEVIANFDPVGAQNNSGLVATDDGGFTLVWIDSGDIEYRRFDANGIALDAADRCSPCWAIRHWLGRRRWAPDLSWLSSPIRATPDILAQMFLANGDPTGSAIPSPLRPTARWTRPLPNSPAAVSSSPGRTKTPIAFASAASTPRAGIPLPRSNVSDWRPRSAAPASRPLANGNFVVAWEDSTDSSVRARFVFSGGFGTEFTVNTSTDGIQIAPRLAALPDGGFVAVYQSGSDIRGQVFDAFGARDGNEFVVNTATSGRSGFPDGERALRRTLCRHLDRRQLHPGRSPARCDPPAGLRSARRLGQRDGEWRDALWP